MSVELIASAGSSKTNACASSQINYQTYAYDVQIAIGTKRLDGNGLQGSVRIAFSLSSQGALTAVSVVSSSGHSTLDSQALDALQAVEFPTAPTNLSVGGKTYYAQYVFS